MVFTAFREESPPVSVCGSRFLMALKAVLLVSEWVKKRHNVLSLTQAGQKALRGSRAFRFEVLVQEYTTRFSWAYLDDANSPEADQLGWAFSLYLLHRYGDECKEDVFYTEKLVQAFPPLAAPIFSRVYQNHTPDFGIVYRWRFWEGFARWFGLVDLEYRKQP